MPIVGHGIDLVEIARIARMLDEHCDRFLEKCFTPAEQAAAESSGRASEFLAGRFAVKEAALKALGTGWRHGIAWTDIEVVPDDHGRPTIRFEGNADRFAQAIAATRWWVSISHAGGFALASVIAEA